eukprot:snap_masked-scaffold_23-processed-gene-4.10-mRNA-1 protein AED:1.00 eAED:1.00 QI:0/0/0/0/1/1/3/0/71
MLEDILMKELFLFSKLKLWEVLFVIKVFINLLLEQIKTKYIDTRIIRKDLVEVLLKKYKKRKRTCFNLSFT